MTCEHSHSNGEHCSGEHCDGEHCAAEHCDGSCHESHEDGCNGSCNSCPSRGECHQSQDALNNRLQEGLGRIRHKIVVMSGKGGVGKSTVAVNLALKLVLEGKRVGLMDVDVHGPSVPKMLHLENESLMSADGKILPINLGDLKVMSIGFLLENPDDAVIWRGPMKISLIQQFLTDVDWGELDYLVIDSPPGTGDEPLSVCQMIPDAAGAIIVTTPQEVAAADVRKSLSFCQQLKFPVLGIVENMSGFVCPKCGERIDVFSSGAGEELAKAYQVPLLGKIPLDPIVCQSGDVGRPFIHQFAESATAKAFDSVVAPILNLSNEK